MHLHIAGIGGTFMGGIAVLAKALGHTVTGCDANLYPPMSTLLASANIPVISGYDAAQLDGLACDCVIIGNALSRGNPLVEAVLNQSVPYTSGPEWLAQHVLQNRIVIAVSGTHGKTTTASMVAWILDCAGLDPGFLIGGEPLNFGVSARLGTGRYFVVEADEYDTAFFDKRSKFVHYHPQICIINNLEYDHADIFPNLEAIQQQFHHLVRTIPSQGALIYPAQTPTIEAVLQKGCWSRQIPLEDKNTWHVADLTPSGDAFTLYQAGKMVGRVEWPLLGRHNIANALAAVAASMEAGVSAEMAVASLCTFQSVARRLEVKGHIDKITVYDDFAHHPTAIATTLAGLRAKVGESPILAILDIRSNTLKMGVHQDSLSNSLILANHVILHKTPQIAWDVQQVANAHPNAQVVDSIEPILQWVQQNRYTPLHVLIMSNGGFGGLYQKLLSLTI